MSLANIIPKEAILQYKHAFDAFDEDNDGKIEAKVLGKLLRALGYDPKPDEVEDMIEDAGGDGKIDFHSFIYLASRLARESDPEGSLISAFKVFDTDGSGRLPVDTIRKILSSLKEPLSHNQIEDLISSSRVGKDNTIGYKEFVQLMLNC